MKVLQAIAAALAGGVVGFFVVTALASVVMSALKVSNREGAAGYAAVAFGRLGGLLGMGTGLWLALRNSGLGLGRGLLHAALAVVGVLAVGALVAVLVYYSRPHPLEIDGARANLELELRVPLARELPPGIERSLRVTLSTANSQVDALVSAERARREDGHLVLPGVVHLPYRERRRLLTVTVPNGPTEVFELDMPAKPKPSKELGPWQRASVVDRKTSESLQRGPLPDGFELRYRVALFGE